MGDFTLQQILEFTRKYFPTRFDYQRRDVLRRVVVKERKEINIKDPSRPQVRFQIETYSYPQYGNYLRMTGRAGRQRRYQRTVRHQYESVLTVQELSMQTTVWKYRLGSQKKWITNPPEKHIKIPSRKLKREMRRKAQRKAGPNATQRQVNQEYRKLVDRHKRNAKYLDVGDYNSQKLGINADFIFRDAWALRAHGHLYGNMSVLKRSSLNSMEIPFFPKHSLALIDYLLYKGVLRP